MALLIEIIACDVRDALNAEKGGADRLEIVAHLDQEGLSPPLSLVREIKQCVRLPLRVMVRPSPDFVNTAPDLIRIMKREVQNLRELDIDGVVVGVLNRQREIDVLALQEILSDRGELGVTFHRAFDLVADQKQALQQLIDDGRVDQVLTSGGAATAWKGLETLARLQSMAGDAIRLIAGGGLNKDNFLDIAAKTGIREFHFGRSVRSGARPNGMVEAYKVKEIVIRAREFEQVHRV